MSNLIINTKHQNTLQTGKYYQRRNNKILTLLLRTVPCSRCSDRHSPSSHHQQHLLTDRCHPRRLNWSSPNVNVTCARCHSVNFAIVRAFQVKLSRTRSVTSLSVKYETNIHVRNFLRTTFGCLLTDDICVQSYFKISPSKKDRSIEIIKSIGASEYELLYQKKT